MVTSMDRRTPSFQDSEFSILGKQTSDRCTECARYSNSTRSRETLCHVDITPEGTVEPEESDLRKITELKVTSMQSC